MKNLDYWFGEITTLGELSDHDLVERLKTLGEKKLAESIEIALMEADLEGPAHRFSAQGRRIRDGLPWVPNFHVMGYIPPPNTARALVKIAPTEGLEADPDLFGRRITLGLAGFQPYRYPGAEEGGGGRAYRVLFHFSARHYPGEEELLHFNISHRAREQEPFRFLGQTVFSGLTVDELGLDLGYMILPLYDPCDTSFFEAMSSATAGRGLGLSEQPQPAAISFSDQAFQTTNKVLRGMDPVSQVHVGLDFRVGGQTAPMRTGTYIVAQVPPEDEMLFEDDGWSDWLFSLRTGQIVGQRAPRELFPYNYVLLTVDPFARPRLTRRWARSSSRGKGHASPEILEERALSGGGSSALERGSTLAVEPDLAEPKRMSKHPEGSFGPGDRVEVGGKADLTIRVRIENSEGALSFVYELDSGVPELDFPPVPLPGPSFRMSPDDYRNQMLSMIADLGKGLFKEETLSKKDVEARLVDLGRHLYTQLFPEEMRKAYRYFRDKIRSLRIITPEPWIPWEILRPYDADGNEVIDDDFLCLRYELTRWHLGAREPKSEIGIRRMAAVHAGRVAGLQPLRKADDEYAMLTGLAAEYPGIDDRSLIGEEADRGGLVRLLEEGGLDLLHIIGHGDFDAEKANSAAIYLQDHHRLMSTSIVGPIATEIARSRPLVFLSSCLAGQQDFSLTGLGGWASAFVTAGCGAFLGPQWSISDSSAYELSHHFYSALKEGQTFGSAAREARNALAGKGSRSALLGSLSLVVYAHPNGRVLFPRPAE